MSFEVLGIADAKTAATREVFTDGETTKIVQSAIMALPQYKTDAALSLAPYGADGKWGPTTARSVGRFNDYYRAGGASDSDGPWITQGTLDALKLSPVNAPTTVPVSSTPVRPKTLASSVPVVSIIKDALVNDDTPMWQKGLGLGLGAAALAGIVTGITLWWRRR